MDYNEGMKQAVENTVYKRLKRTLSRNEKRRILKPRGLLAYEMIIDSLEDRDKTVKELEEYLKSID